MTTIVIGDDHPLILRYLKVLLKNDPEFKIRGIAHDGIEALKLVQKLKPDVLVIALKMPGKNGLEVAREVRSDSLQTRVIICSLHAEYTYVRQALQSGAVGYVLKDSWGDLFQAIRQVARGEQFVSPLVDDVLPTYRLFGVDQIQGIPVEGR